MGEHGGRQQHATDMFRTHSHLTFSRHWKPCSHLHRDGSASRFPLSFKTDGVLIIYKVTPPKKEKKVGQADNGHLLIYHLRLYSTTDWVYFMQDHGSLMHTIPGGASRSPSESLEIFNLTKNSCTVRTITGYPQTNVAFAWLPHQLLAQLIYHVFTKQHVNFYILG